ncbi:MAG TPA: RidA family protein [Mycobacteriales bacterium]|jgi:2-iminobutanoate/2-iminopropanoate deaminase|nr:RidA family protein [Mycobacteriales bacterium]
MEKSVVHSPLAPKTIPEEFRGQEQAILAAWPRWSQGIRTANFLFASGTGGTDVDGRAQHVDDVAQQIQLALARLVSTLESGGGRVTDVFKVRVFLDDPAGFDGAVQALEEFFAPTLPGRRPALAVVVANTSDRALHAEVEAWAATSHESVTCPSVLAGLHAGAVRADWAHATRVGNLWFTAGLLATAPDGSLDGTPAQQACTAFDNLLDVLASCGRTAGDLVKLTVWVAEQDAADEVVGTVDLLLRGVFPAGDLPVLTALVAPLPVAGAAVQLEAVATSSPRQIVATTAAPCRTPGRRGFTQAIKVPIETAVGSYLRRFTWPAHLDEAQLAAVGGDEAPQQLGHLVFLAGLAGLTPTGELPPGMRAQARQVFASMAAITEAAGGTFADVVQFDVYYADRALYADYNAERIAYLEAHVPDKAWFAGSGPRARSTLPGAVLEIESIAVVP